MLIIYGNEGQIQFACSDDDYVKTYKEKHGSLPYLNHGENGLWLKGEPFPEDLEMYKVDVQKKALIKKNKKKIEEVILGRKNRITRIFARAKNVEIEIVQTD